ncbi:ABC transporter permease [Halalkalicoccus sp. NIPERK01]|uniref:ABC transporter permease n=1 Tax=Halalkalicoccus sp. NIPERK01 TaxID=3053469 RepID=UPI00256F66C3|nr:ABC transporter permease [Halalkalicoccus sp. NIPERK01]MDL5363260.1 ABC transporter permease [Halalkalicoccus sp. NIPERK01]
MGAETQSAVVDRVRAPLLEYLIKYPVLVAILTWIGVTALFVVLNPSVMLQPNIWGNIFRQTALIGPVAIMVAVLMIGGDFDMTVGANYAMSAMAFILIVNQGIPPSVAMLMTLALGGTVGLLNGVLVTATGIHSFIITLGGWFSIRGALLLLFSGSARLESDIAIMQIFSYEFGAGFEALVLWMFLVLLGALYLVHRTSYGNHLYAVGSDRDAARARGIRVTRTRLIAFMLTGMAASFAALMHVARFGSARPVLQTELPLVAIAAAVLGGCALFGGRGSPNAGFFGALTFGTFGAGLVAAGASSAWYQFFVGVVLVGAVVFNRYVDRLRQEKR